MHFTARGALHGWPRLHSGQLQMRPQPLHDLSSNGKQKRTAYAVICAHTLFGPTSAHKNNHGAGQLTFPDVSKCSPTISRGLAMLTAHVETTGVPGTTQK